jgi:hypothetical protein
MRRILVYLFAPWVSVLVTAVCVVMLLVTQGLVSLVGHLPAGELLIALLFIPVLLLNILAVPVVFVVGWLTYPAIASRQLGTLLAPVRIARGMFQRPRAFVQHAVVAWVLAQGGLGLLATIVISSVIVTLFWVATSLGVERLTQILGVGPLAAGLLRSAGPLGTLLGGRSVINNLASDPLSIVIARDLFILGGASILGALFAFPTVYLLTASCSAFLALWPAAAPVAETAQITPEATAGLATA